MRVIKKWQLRSCAILLIALILPFLIVSYGSLGVSLRFGLGASVLFLYALVWKMSQLENLEPGDPLLTEFKHEMDSLSEEDRKELGPEEIEALNETIKRLDQKKTPLKVNKS